MVKRNPNFENLKSQYLFPEIARRKREFTERYPNAKLQNLGIGDTTLPLAPHIVGRMHTAVEGLAHAESYTGYGPEQGSEELRQSLAQTWYGGRVDSDELFISDGAKCDVARLQMLFGRDVTIAVQDPTYPVYVDTSILMGQNRVILMPCTPDNDFFPDLEAIDGVDVIYFCSPNNPTGAVATRVQLEQLVAFAKKRHAIIVYDSAYAAYIQDPALPKTIYEIPGAEEVAIEVGSFSKMAGFTGVRLGWTVVPKALPHYANWKRLVETCFNGASIIAQAGGIAALEPEGLSEIQRQIDHYIDNTRQLKEQVSKLSEEVYGGEHIPYLWAKMPGGNSWEAFENLLHDAHIITTPGSGFGPSGEGFLRFSGFGARSQTQQKQPDHEQPSLGCPQALW